MGALLKYADEIETLTCGQCGVVFGAPGRLIEARRSDGGIFYCPNGHPRVFRETSEDRLRKEVATLTAQRNEAQRKADYESTQREIERREAAKAQKRLLTRAGAGVCQCCNRAFKQLAQHMKTQHPEMVPALSPPEKPKRGRPRKVVE